MILYTNKIISFSGVLFGDYCDNRLFGNYICTIFAFVIYKDYLLHWKRKERRRKRRRRKRRRKKRPASCTMRYIENEIYFRLEIYISYI